MATGAMHSERWRDAYNHMSKLLGHQVDGSQKFCDVPTMLASAFPDGQGSMDLSANLRTLEKQCLEALKSSASKPMQAVFRKKSQESFISIAPGVQSSDEAGIDKDVDPLAARLWQIGYFEQASIKGASGQNAVLDVMKDALIGRGLQTKKFPIEVVYTWLDPAAAGQHVKDFSIGVGIGFAVVLGSYCLCLAALELNWMSPGVQMTVGDGMILLSASLLHCGLLSSTLPLLICILRLLLPLVARLQLRPGSGPPASKCSLRSHPSLLIASFHTPLCIIPF
jgi:hypothetical protein